MPDITPETDLSVRDQLDAEQLVHTLLNRIDWEHGFDWGGTGYPGLSVISEITPATDSMLLRHPVILYTVGAPYQPDWNLKSWLWRFPLTLTVLDTDAARNFRMCARLNRLIASWPYGEKVPGVGKVGRIVDNPGFRRISTGDMATSKSVTARQSTKLIQAADDAD